MSDEPLYEASFLIPTEGDKGLSDGRPHNTDLWFWLANELYLRFMGATMSPGLFAGVYHDPETSQPVNDQSRKFTVALAESRLNELRDFLRTCCDLFEQKCIYLSIAGRVEFVWKHGHEPNN